MKKTLSVLAVAALAISLAACSSSTGSNGCDATASGSSSSKVKVTGEFGSAPKVKFSKGLSVKKTERSVVIDGKGAVAKANGTATVDYTIYDAASGKKLDQTTYKKGGTAAFPLKAPLLSGMIKGLTCSAKGSRVVAVVPPKEAFGSAGSAGLGVKPTDSLVFVFDVVDVTAPVKALSKANGKPQAPVAGLPTVKLGKDGAPTITIPKGDPPTKLTIENLKKGSGKTVKDGETVTVNYTGVVYGTGKVFDSSWTKGTPASFPVKTGPGGVVNGFYKAIVGQKIGSQVIAVIPSADGYGAGGNPAAGISGTDTLVFVVDILGVGPAAG